MAFARAAYFLGKDTVFLYQRAEDLTQVAVSDGQS